jgi:hypothetical protein
LGKNRGQNLLRSRCLTEEFIPSDLLGVHDVMEFLALHYLVFTHCNIHLLIFLLDASVHRLQDLLKVSEHRLVDRDAGLLQT